MPKPLALLLPVFICMSAVAQPKLDTLTVEKIMRDPKWIGTSPNNPAWSLDGRYLFFGWNPNGAPSDSLYFIAPPNTEPVKASVGQRRNLLTENMVSYNRSRTAYTYAKDGDIFFFTAARNITRQVTKTTDLESDPQFSFNDARVIYNRNQNLYSWDVVTGETTQLTNLLKGMASKENTDNLPAQEKWLKNDQMQYMQVLRDRKERKDKAEAYDRALPEKKTLRTIFMGDKTAQSISISPDGRHVCYRLFSRADNARSTIVPSFVTESGFTIDIITRSKVGAAQGTSEFFLFDREADTVYAVKEDSISGIRDLPDYLKDYPAALEKAKKDSAIRSVAISGPYWSPLGTHALVDVFSDDNKDRWLMLLDDRGKLSLVDRQRDEAWIGGPGIGFFEPARVGWIDENTCWFQSEVTGFSHLYTVNVVTGKKVALTQGNYEVQSARLSKDKKYFYITTNAIHPGEKQFYRLPVTGGQSEQITGMTGNNEVSLSPDEKSIAILYSYANKPWELYIQENKPGAKSQQVTNKAQSEEFRSYAWRVPDVITIKARDNANVYARLYKPLQPHPSHPAVIFVHGAGYLQNAHKWWSSYFREYMFDNLLTDKGYYVLDIDYRGSAGYGRDWRTAIYRHMGGKDLQDQVDAAAFLVKNFNVDPKRIGVFGGSYGGFITLMALFTTPDVFAAGAALRPVTDWANYNHFYTSNILNEPFRDSLAYRRSSPIYYAAGLKSPLLICHGMVDVNVHFQDAVKVTQRLIELGKKDWELAVYPMEDHGFIEPSSWCDEYTRILKLFETVLKR